MEKPAKLDTLREIRRMLDRGMTKEELEQNKNRAVAPGMSVADYVEMRLDFDEVVRKGDLIIVKKNA